METATVLTSAIKVSEYQMQSPDWVLLAHLLLSPAPWVQRRGSAALQPGLLWQPLLPVKDAHCWHAFHVAAEATTHWRRHQPLAAEMLPRLVVPSYSLCVFGNDVLTKWQVCICVCVFKRLARDVCPWHSTHYPLRVTSVVTLGDHRVI